MLSQNLGVVKVLRHGNNSISGLGVCAERLRDRSVREENRAGKITARVSGGITR